MKHNRRKKEAITLNITYNDGNLCIIAQPYNTIHDVLNEINLKEHPAVHQNIMIAEWDDRIQSTRMSELTKGKKTLDLFAYSIPDSEYTTAENDDITDKAVANIPQHVRFADVHTVTDIDMDSTINEMTSASAMSTRQVNASDNLPVSSNPADKNSDNVIKLKIKLNDVAIELPALTTNTISEILQELNEIVNPDNPKQIKIAEWLNYSNNSRLDHLPAILRTMPLTAYEPPILMANYSYEVDLYDDIVIYSFSDSPNPEGQVLATQVNDYCFLNHDLVYNFEYSSDSTYFVYEISAYQQQKQHNILYDSKVVASLDFLSKKEEDTRQARMM